MAKIKKTTEEMFEIYCTDKEHAKQVMEYCEKLFDALNGIIFEAKEKEKEKEYLTSAALLHDIGYFKEKKSHHKHTMEMITEEGLEGYTDEETALIANIARYHRSALPDETRHQEFSALDKEKRSTVKKLASILRIADGLDKPHKNLILRMRVEETPESITFYVKTVGFKPKLETAKKKSDLFEETFKKPLNFILE